MRAGAIVTVPPHATRDHLVAVARHPFTVGLRLNTVMPIAGRPGDALARLAGLGQPLFVDLKGRQLRVTQPAVPPFTEVRLSHPIELRTPAWAWFGNGREPVRVLAVDGARLILEDGPRRVLGPGESVNIPDPSLRVEGLLTPQDEAYLQAMVRLGLEDVMLSFVERASDLEAVRALHPTARLVAKIESRRGLAAVRAGELPSCRLMAARGDLFLELAAPHELPEALEAIAAADPEAIVASRLCDSLAWEPTPSAPDVTDAAYLLRIGYRTLMLGDEVCLERDSALAALDLLAAVAARRPPLGGLGGEAPQRAKPSSLGRVVTRPPAPLAGA